MNIEDAPKISKHNHAEIQTGIVCGCYQCLALFDGGAVEEWADEGTTALCPRCSVDAVLPGVNDTDVLVAACEHWFTG